MRDSDCVDLLRWASAELGLRAQGFRRVRGQVCRRVARRIVALGLDGPTAYRAFVAATPGERAVLEALWAAGHPFGSCRNGHKVSLPTRI